MNDMEKAIFAGGCFWGIEERFRKTNGVTNTRVGYIGGDFKEPTYEKVCGGSTGHAEAVEVSFNPEEISYSELLDIFWEVHDPTQLNRQGPDVGEQYRSAIFYFNDEQKKLAEASKDALGTSGKYDSEIVTQIAPASDFWQAEDYHQQYFKKQGR